MRRKYYNQDKFTPSPLPTELKRKFKLTRETEGGVIRWRLKGVLGISDFTKLFHVVQTVPVIGEKYPSIQVFNPKLDEWISKNCLKTFYTTSDELSDVTRHIATYKFGCYCGSGNVFDVNCREIKRFFGMMTAYVFDITLDNDNESFINEYGEIEHILKATDPVRYFVYDLPILKEIEKKNDAILKKNPGKTGSMLLDKGYQRFSVSSITRCENHYIVEVNGGNNGCSNWKKYLENFNRFFSELSDKYHTWLIRFENDCADDLHTFYIGFSEIDQIVDKTKRTKMTKIQKQTKNAIKKK